MYFNFIYLLIYILKCIYSKEFHFRRTKTQIWATQIFLEGPEKQDLESRVQGQFLKSQGGNAYY